MRLQGNLWPWKHPPPEAGGAAAGEAAEGWVGDGGQAGRAAVVGRITVGAAALQREAMLGSMMEPCICLAWQAIPCWVGAEASAAVALARGGLAVALWSPKQQSLMQPYTCRKVASSMQRQGRTACRQRRGCGRSRRLLQHHLGRAPLQRLAPSRPGRLQRLGLRAWWGMRRWLCTLGVRSRSMMTTMTEVSQFAVTVTYGWLF